MRSRFSSLRRGLTMALAMFVALPLRAQFGVNFQRDQNNNGRGINHAEAGDRQIGNPDLPRGGGQNLANATPQTPLPTGVNYLRVENVRAAATQMGLGAGQYIITHDPVTNNLVLSVNNGQSITVRPTVGAEDGGGEGQAQTFRAVGDGGVRLIFGPNSSQVASGMSFNAASWSNAGNQTALNGLGARQNDNTVTATNPRNLFTYVAIAPAGENQPVVVVASRIGIPRPAERADDTGLAGTARPRAGNARALPEPNNDNPAVAAQMPREVAMAAGIPRNGQQGVEVRRNPANANVFHITATLGGGSEGISPDSDVGIAARAAGVSPGQQFTMTINTSNRAESMAIVSVQTRPRAGETPASLPRPITMAQARAIVALLPDNASAASRREPGARTTANMSPAVRNAAIAQIASGAQVRVDPVNPNLISVSIPFNQLPPAARTVVVQEITAINRDLPAGERIPVPNGNSRTQIAMKFDGTEMKSLTVTPVGGEARAFDRGAGGWEPARAGANPAGANPAAANPAAMAGGNAGANLPAGWVDHEVRDRSRDVFGDGAAPVGNRNGDQVTVHGTVANLTEDAKNQISAIPALAPLLNQPPGTTISVTLTRNRGDYQITAAAQAPMPAGAGAAAAERRADAPALASAEAVLQAPPAGGLPAPARQATQNGNLVSMNVRVSELPDDRRTQAQNGVNAARVGPGAPALGNDVTNLLNDPSAVVRITVDISRNPAPIVGAGIPATPAAAGRAAAPAQMINFVGGFELPAGVNPVGMPAGGAGAPAAGAVPAPAPAPPGPGMLAAAGARLLPPQLAPLAASLSTAQTNISGLRTPPNNATRFELGSFSRDAAPVRHQLRTTIESFKTAWTNGTIPRTPENLAAINRAQSLLQSAPTASTPRGQVAVLWRVFNTLNELNFR